MASSEAGRYGAAAQALFRVFLLSPADCSGKRAQLLRSANPSSEWGQRVRRREGVELGDVFSFVSSLYFRGKLAYARAFARPPRGVAGVQVITPCDGLRVPESPLRVRDLQRYARVPVDPEESRYRKPLLRDLHALRPSLVDTEVVLLGSIASPKYVELLSAALGPQVVFPLDFVGRGDMSRGGLMLRCVDESRELCYVPLIGARRHGARPSRLPPAASMK